jgi:predicted GIY-YIG superfamily endonuclease
MPFIYLLHFDEPLSHARHYLGSTEDLPQRLAAHANGQGARITEVLKENGQHWTLAAIFQPIDKTETIRELESKTKKQKASPTYCPICNPDTHAAPAGTIQVPCKQIHSSTLRTTP